MERSLDLGPPRALIIPGISEAERANVTKAVQTKQAFARPVPENTKSKLAAPGEVPIITGPTTEAQRLEVEGTSEDIWKRCVEFCRSLENTDLEIQDSSFKIRGHNYQLPRYTVFRLQLFQNEKNTTPFTVELQRREGDAYLHGLIFQGLKNEFEDAPEIDILSSHHCKLVLRPNRSPEVEMTVSAVSAPDEIDIPARMRSLNLESSPDEVLQWISHLHSKDLVACRSGAATLAFAAENPENFKILTAHASKILEGIQQVLPRSEDPATAHGCCAFLAAVSNEGAWMKLCDEINLSAQLAEAALLWSGQSKKKNLHHSQTILRLIVKALTPFKKSLGQPEKEKLMIASKVENSLTSLL